MTVETVCAECRGPAFETCVLPVDDDDFCGKSADWHHDEDPDAWHLCREEQRHHGYQPGWRHVYTSRHPGERFGLHRVAGPELHELPTGLRRARGWWEQRVCRGDEPPPDPDEVDATCLYCREEVRGTAGAVAEYVGWRSHPGERWRVRPSAEALEGYRRLREEGWPR